MTKEISFELRRSGIPGRHQSLCRSYGAFEGHGAGDDYKDVAPLELARIDAGIGIEMINTGPNKALQATPGAALVAIQPVSPGAPELGR